MAKRWSDPRKKDPWNTGKDRTRDALEKIRKANITDAQSRSALSPEAYAKQSELYKNTDGMAERTRTLRELETLYRKEGENYIRDFDAVVLLSTLLQHDPNHEPNLDANNRTITNVFVDGGLQLNDVRCHFEGLPDCKDLESMGDRIKSDRKLASDIYPRSKLVKGKVVTVTLSSDQMDQLKSAYKSGPAQGESPGR